MAERRSESGACAANEWCAAVCTCCLDFDCRVARHAEPFAIDSDGSESVLGTRAQSVDTNQRCVRTRSIRIIQLRICGHPRTGRARPARLDPVLEYRCVLNSWRRRNPQDDVISADPPDCNIGDWSGERTVGHDERAGHAGRAGTLVILSCHPELVGRGCVQLLHQNGADQRCPVACNDGTDRVAVASLPAVFLRAQALLNLRPSTRLLCWERGDWFNDAYGLERYLPKSRSHAMRCHATEGVEMQATASPP